MRIVRVQRFLGQKEAVGAIDVARGPAWLRQQVETRRAVGRQGIFGHVSHPPLVVDGPFPSEALTSLRRIGHISVACLAC